MWKNGHYVFQKHNLLSSESVPHDVKNYFDFYPMFGLKQLIQSPTRITCSSSCIIDHILASFPDRVTQRRILSVGLSDHQLIYRSFKNYTTDGYEKALVEINFPKYKNFDSVNDAYSNFIQKLMEVIDKVVPVKNKRIKRNSQEWFDSEISEKLIIRDKLFKKFMYIKRFIKEHDIMCKISWQKRKNNFLKTNSKSVSVNLKTYGKVLHHSDYLKNLVDV